MGIINLLLVEDNLDDRLLFERAIRVSGIPADLTCAKDAAEAVTRLNRLTPFSAVALPDLIILDLGLPGITGQTLLQVIRNAYGSHAIPVIIMTGSTRPQDETACAALGIASYQVKPLAFEQMVEFVADLPRLVKRSQSERLMQPKACS